MGAGAKKKKVVCTCKKRKGDNPNCQACNPPDEWTTHKDEDLGQTFLNPPDPESAKKGVQLSKDTSK